MFDNAGFACAEVPRSECPPPSTCDTRCDVVCSIMDLLPSGAAWQATNGIDGDYSLCEPFSACDPCEPVFVRNFTRTMALQYERSRKNASWIIAQMDPLTAPDRSYWLRKWGLDKLLKEPRRGQCVEVSPCAESTGAFCEPQDRCEPSPDLLAAIEYAMIRARVLTSRPQFVPSFNGINRAMSFFGYHVSRYTGKPKEVCKSPGMAYDSEPPCSSIPPFATNNNGIDECKDWDTQLPDCPRENLAYDTCSPCVRPRWRLQLAPAGELLVPAPGDPCAKPKCDIGGALCEPLTAMNGVAATCISSLTGTKRRPASVYAAAYLRLIWPVWQPYEIVEIFQ